MILTSAGTIDVLGNAFGAIFLNEVGAMTFEYYINKIERTRTKIFTSDAFMRHKFDI